MALYLQKIQWVIPGSIKVIMTLVMLLSLTTGVLAQEADLFGSTEDENLLFGDEFDVGGDDFSFDLEEGDESDADPSDDGDFFGDLNDEGDEAAEDEFTDPITAPEDDWGIESATDYESLMTRAADEADPFGDQPSDHPLDFSDNVKGTILEGTGFTFSLYSPQYVGTSLKTWYSYLDYSFTSTLPWHVTVYPVEISFVIDISSFNFDNSFPAGGDFKGVSVMPTVCAEIYGLEVELGAGTFYPSFGALAGIGYSFQFHSLFASAGYRWNWAYDIDPIGEAWWLEPRFTVGVKLW